jgi:hypothetical protein
MLNVARGVDLRVLTWHLLFLHLPTWTKVPVQAFTWNCAYFVIEITRNHSQAVRFSTRHSLSHTGYIDGTSTCKWRPCSAWITT